MRSDLAVPDIPHDMPRHAAYRLRVRVPGGAWHDVFVHRVRVNPMNLSYAGMATFSFDGDVEVEVTHAAAEIATCEVRPGHVGSEPRVDGDTVRFTLTQGQATPPKCAVIINGGVDTCLHILGQPMERDAPQPTDANVHVVQPGQTPIPLPEGKDTYYFAAGIHETAHLGAWLEVDLGEPATVAHVRVEQLEHAHALRVYGRLGPADGYTLMGQCGPHRDRGGLSVSLDGQAARYVKIQFDANPLEHDEPFAVKAKAIALLDAAGEPLAVAGVSAASHRELGCLVDGDAATRFSARNVGGLFHLYADGQRVHLDAGAVVHGGVHADGLCNVSLTGRGILDASRSPHTTNNAFADRVGNYVRFHRCKDVRLEGVSILDSPAWTLHAGCENLHITDLNIIGWFFNSDGIGLSGARNAVVERCFVRTGDDVVTLHEGEHIEVRDCVFWGDKAHIVLIGLFDKVVSNVVMKNIDVLGSYEPDDIFQGVIAIHSANNSVVEDVTFDTWRVAGFRNPARARVIVIHMDMNTPWCHTPGKRVSNIVLRHIDYAGDGENPSLIHGASGERCVDGVLIEGCRRNGQPITSAADGNLEIGPHAGNIRWA